MTWWSTSSETSARSISKLFLPLSAGFVGGRLLIMSLIKAVNNIYRQFTPRVLFT